jgi:hypothetical protein
MLELRMYWQKVDWILAQTGFCLVEDLYFIVLVKLISTPKYMFWSKLKNWGSRDGSTMLELCVYWAKLDPVLVPTGLVWGKTFILLYWKILHLLQIIVFGIG